MNQNASSYLDYIYIMDSLKSYASPKSKLTTMINSGKLIKLRRGLYISSDNTSYSIKTLANKIYGPSYISFEYALSYYNLIPERVESITSAAFNKNKNKQFNTSVGSFIYKNINPTAYPHGIVRIEEDGNPFLIATKEKAICDTLSKINGIRDLKFLNLLLIEDLRFDMEKLLSVNIKDVAFLALLYRKEILTLFLQYLEREAPCA